MKKRVRKEKRTVKELTLTLVFTGKTTRSLDDLLEVALRSLASTNVVAPWAEKVRASKWVARDLTIHPRRVS